MTEQNSKQYRVKCKGFSETFATQEKAQAVFETQKNRLQRKKESFTLQLFERINPQSEWVMLDEIKRSASFYNED